MQVVPGLTAHNSMYMVPGGGGLSIARGDHPYCHSWFRGDHFGGGGGNYCMTDQVISFKDNSEILSNNIPTLSQL